MGGNPVLLQQFIDGNPIHTGRFHGNGIDANGTEPGDEGMEVGCGGTEGAHGLWVAMRWNRDHELVGTNIDASGSVGEERQT
jgi:hypothetical protein